MNSSRWYGNMNSSRLAFVNSTDWRGYPAANTALPDWWVHDMLMNEYPFMYICHNMDFTINLSPRSSRKSLGRAAEILGSDGVWRYAVWDKIQFHGDEDSKEGISNKVYEKKGNICLIQNDLTPTLENLLGMLDEEGTIQEQHTASSKRPSIVQGQPTNFGCPRKERECGEAGEAEEEEAGRKSSAQLQPLTTSSCQQRVQHSSLWTATLQYSNCTKMLTFVDFQSSTSPKISYKMPKK